MPDTDEPAVSQHDEGTKQVQWTTIQTSRFAVRIPENLDEARDAWDLATAAVDAYLNAREAQEVAREK